MFMGILYMVWLDKADRLINIQASSGRQWPRLCGFGGGGGFAREMGDALPVNRNSKGTCSVAWPVTSTHVRFTRAQQKVKISIKGDEGGVLKVALSKSSTGVQECIARTGRTTRAIAGRTSLGCPTLLCTVQ